MRVVAGSGVARDLSEAEIDRHIEMASRFVERAKDPALGKLRPGASAHLQEG
jgi:hypothetical protein